MNTNLTRKQFLEFFPTLSITTGTYISPNSIIPFSLELGVENHMKGILCQKRQDCSYSRELKCLQHNAEDPFFYPSLYNLGHRKKRDSRGHTTTLVDWLTMEHAPHLLPPDGILKYRDQEWGSLLCLPFCPAPAFPQAVLQWAAGAFLAPGWGNVDDKPVVWKLTWM